MTNLEMARLSLAESFEGTRAATLAYRLRSLPSLASDGAPEIWRDLSRLMRHTSRAAMSMLGSYPLSEVIAWQDVFERVDAFEKAFTEALRERAARAVVEVAA